MKRNKLTKKRSPAGINASTAPASSEPKVANKNSKRLKKIMAIALAACAILLYVHTVGHDYAIDDGTVIQNNKFTKEGVSAIPKMLSTPYRAGFWDRTEGLYRPLSLIMFAVEYEIVGQKPWLGHLINILLYGLTAYFLFLTLTRVLTKYNLIIPLVTTLLFVFHPLHSEVIANIKSRDEILGFLFTILTIFYLFKNIKSENLKDILLAGVFFFLALLSKESAITAVVFIPLTIYFFTKLRISDVFKKSLVIFGVTAIYMGIRMVVLGGIEYDVNIQPINNSLLEAPDFLSQKATAIMILGKYLVKLIFPHPLSFDYSYNQIPNVGLGDIKFILSFLIYAFFSVYAIIKFKSRDVFAYCILFFFITISLVSNVVILIESVFGERFLYVSSLAFCLAAAILLARAFKVELKKSFYNSFNDILKHKTAFTAVLAVILVLYSFKTVSRAAQWKNNIALLKNDIITSPNSARVHYAYGSAIVIEGALKEEDEIKKQQMLDEGIIHLQRGVEILPTYSDAFFHMGVAYKEKKDYANAIKAFERARLNKTWDDPEFYIASGIAYGSAGQPLKGIEDLKTAIKYKKDAGDEIYNNLGIYYCDAGLYQESLDALNKCIEQDAENEKAYYNIGNTYARMNQFPTAISYYAKAIELKPDYTDAYNNTGNSYAQQQNYPKAIEFYNKVIELNPNNTKVLFNVGITHYALKNYPKALEFFNKVIQLEPNNANAYYNIGNTYRDIGDIANANINFLKARQLGLNI